jgi:DNA-binding NarL/FixJ family response regulator
MNTQVTENKEVKAATRAKKGESTNHLTTREKEVLTQLCAGLSSTEIASEMGLSPRTVDAHRARIMIKLNIHHMPGLVKYAIVNKLTSTEI